MAVTNLVELVDNEITAETKIQNDARQALADAQAAEREARDAMAQEIQKIHALEIKGDSPAELQRRRIAVVELRRRELQSGAEVRAAGARAKRATARLSE